MSRGGKLKQTSKTFCESIPTSINLPCLGIVGEGRKEILSFSPPTLRTPTDIVDTDEKSAF